MRVDKSVIVTGFFFFFLNEGGALGDLEQETELEFQVCSGELIHLVGACPSCVCVHGGGVVWERPLPCFCSRKRVSRPVPALFPLLSPRCLDDLNIFPLVSFQVRVYMSFILSIELLWHKTYPVVCLWDIV